MANGANNGNDRVVDLIIDLKESLEREIHGVKESLQREIQEFRAEVTTRFDNQAARLDRQASSAH